MDVIATLAALANQYGILIVIVLVLLVNAKAILGAVGKLIGKLYPAWAKHRSAAKEWERGRADRAYTDAVTTLQGVLEDARAELRSSAQERRILQAYLIKHLGQYEQLAARTVAAIQDVGEALTELTERLRQLNGHAGAPPTKKEGTIRE